MFFGIAEPTILAHYLKEREFTISVQTMLNGEFGVKVKDEFEVEHRIKYHCSVCRVGREYHDQQLLEWGAYEWIRKYPNKKEQLWENLRLDDDEYDKYFFVGNLH